MVLYDNKATSTILSYMFKLKKKYVRNMVNVSHRTCEVYFKVAILHSHFTLGFNQQKTFTFLKIDIVENLKR